MELRTKFFLILLATLFVACEQSNTHKKSAQADIESTTDKTLTIDTFSTFPSELKGCVCYYSNDSIDFKKGKYIYVNDFEQTSFLKINGILFKFKQIDFQGETKKKRSSKARTEDFEIKVEVNDGPLIGNKTWSETGKITLVDKNGKTITKTFYGHCGC